MARGSARFYVVTALVLLIGGAVALSLLQPVFGTRADFSIYNTRWNGASGLAGDLYGTGDLVPAFSLEFGEGDQVQLAHRSLDAHQLDPPAHTVLVLAPSKAPSEREAAWLAAFVEDGGRLVVADDFGAGNAFLEASGADTRIDGALVADLAYSRQPPFVVVTDVDEHPATGGARELLLDHGSVLAPGPNATVLARTGDSAWLDADLDRVQDADEETGPFELAAVETVGEGRVLVVSDPSLYINGMQDEADNARATQGLVAWSSAQGRDVLVDEAHRDYPDPVRFAGATLAEVDERTAWMLGGAAFGLFLVFALGRPEAWVRGVRERVQSALDTALPQPEAEERDPVELVRRRHPDWNETTLRQVEEAWEEEHGGGGPRGRA